MDIRRCYACVRGHRPLGEAMIQTFELFPGIVLRCFPDLRFKQGCLSVQLLRPMDRAEAALNALIPAVLLRGTKKAPDLRAITLRLDDLYGAAVGTLVRRVGDYQTTGLYCSFVEDRYALEGDRVLEPMIGFLEELLFQPVLEQGAFRRDYVESEKRNLILTMESQLNDKRVYANSQLIRKMCTRDSFGIPRLGEPEQVEQITAQSAYEHYCRILAESPMELFYVGAAQPEQVAALLKPLFEGIERTPVALRPQTAFSDPAAGNHTEQMDVTQGKLCMGFVSPVTLRDEGFAAMQVCNMLFGGGMTSKLFMQIREARSLCYDIGSGYHGSKGIVTVSAGIDFDREVSVREQVLELLAQCGRGEFTQEELTAAKQALISQLQSTHDSPGSIENYYVSGLLSGLNKTPEAYIAAVEAVTAEQVAQAARSLKLHTVYFLKGVR